MGKTSLGFGGFGGGGWWCS